MDMTQEVKKVLRSLLVSSAVKVTVSSLNKDYRDLEDVLRVNGTLAQSEVTLVVSEKIAHVNDMVMKQRKPSKNKNSSQPRKSVINATSSKYNINLAPNHCMEYQSISQKQVATSVVTPFPNHRMENKCMSQIQVVTPISEYLTSFSKPLLCPTRSTDGMQSMNNHNDSSTGHNLISANIPISSLPFPKPQLPISPNRVLSLGKHTLGSIQNGFRKIEEVGFVSGISKPQSNSLINTKNSTVSFRNGQNIDNDCTGLANIENETSVDIPKGIQINLEKLISTCPCGIWCSELPLEYKKLYGKELQFEVYGYSCLINLCLTLENIFHCEKESSCDYKLYDRQKPIPKIKMANEFRRSHPNMDTQEIDPFTINAVTSLDWNEYPDLIPEGVFKLGKKIANVIDNQSNFKDTIQIVVCEICDPGKFWMFKDDGLLNRLMNSMQDFYRTKKPQYLIPEFLLEVGLYCVVYNLNEFQRGLVVDLVPDIGGHVRIYFIDYGTTANLPREKIWFLVEEYSNLPAQAIRAKLGNIQPAEKVWSKQSSLRFRDLISDIHVFAKISEVTEKTVTVHIAANNTPLKFINDTLVEEGYAEYIIKVWIQRTTTGYLTD